MVNAIFFFFFCGQCSLIPFLVTVNVYHSTVFKSYLNCIVFSDAEPDVEFQPSFYSVVTPLSLSLSLSVLLSMVCSVVEITASHY